MDILNPNRSFRIETAVTGGATLYGQFPRPSQERKIENEILRRLDGHAAGEYSENSDIPVRTRIAVELNVAVTGASDPDLLERIGDWEDLDDAELLIRISNEYFRLKNEFLARIADWGLERRGSPDSAAERKSRARSMDFSGDRPASRGAESDGPVSGSETLPIPDAKLSGSAGLGRGQESGPADSEGEEPRIQSGNEPATRGYGVPTGGARNQREGSGGSSEDTADPPDP